MRNKIIKSFFIIFFTIILTGCNTNYQSLNDLVIVSSILLDTENNSEYVAYVELYKQNKEDKESESSYFVKGSGNNIQDAINNASSSISKDLYLVHTNAIVISENLASEKINEVFNYLESKVQMNSNYYLLISENIEELMNSKDEDNSVLGEKISNTLKYSTNSGTMVNYDFMEKLKNYISKDKDIYLSNIEVKDKNVTITNGYYFSGTKLVGKLSNEELKLINLFKNYKNLYFTFNYNKDQYILKIDNSKIKYILDDDINIKINVKANIVEVGTNIDILNSDSIDALNNYSSESLERRFNDLLIKLKNNNSDILGINNYIYKIYSKNVKGFFKDDVNIDVNVDISKKGLINKTLGGNYEK